MTIRYMLTILLFLFGGGYSLAACQDTSSSTETLPLLTIQLSWTHSAQFAGFYAAEQNGNYAAEGLAVTFIEGGPTVDRMAAVLDGTAQFGVASGPELIIARADGVPIKAIATIFRRSPFAFFALAESGIDRPEDFVDKTIQVRERARPVLLAMMAHVDIAPDQFEEDPTADFEALYTGEVDVATGFVTTQHLQAEQAGYKLNIIYPDDYGVHFSTDSILTTDDFIEAKPDLVTRFLRATFQGWTYVIENPADVESLVSEYDPSANPDLVNAEMLASLPFINTGQDYIGWMNPEIWKGMEQTLREHGLLTKQVDAIQIYTLQFLRDIYQAKRENR